MKNLRMLLYVTLIMLVVISCSKNDDPSNNLGPKEIAFTQKEIALPLQTRPLTSYFWVTKEKNGDVFYIHNATGSVTSSRGLYKYTATNNTFSELTWSNVFTDAGYISTLVSDGNYLYYCANDFVRYTIGSNVWEDYNTHYPGTAKSNNGEPGVIVLGANIYFVGGRGTESQKVKYFDTISKTWINFADYPVIASNGPALTSDGTRYIYARSKVPNDFYRLDTQNVVWTKMADCPVNIRKGYSLNIMSQINSNIIVLLGDDKKIYAYNISENKWKVTTTTVPVPDTVNCHIETATNKNKFFVLFKKANDQLGVLEYTLN